MIITGIVSLVQTFQLSKHPLVPACSDKSLPTIHPLYVNMLLLELTTQLIDESVVTYEHCQDIF